MKTNLTNTTILVSVIVSLFNQSLANNWWEDQKGININSYEQFKELINNENSLLKDTHLLVEFYMERCPYCIRFKDDWNRMYDEADKKYNKPDKPKHIEFILINGPEHQDLRHKYKVNGFPTFIYLAASKKGLKAKEFEEGERTQNTMQKWLFNEIDKHDST